jgi:hypothetical protein
MSHPLKGRYQEANKDRETQHKKLKAAIREKEAKEREYLSKTSLKDIVH